MIQPLTKLSDRLTKKPVEPIIWVTTLDGRYFLEIVRTEKENGYIATFRLYDQLLKDKLIIDKKVWLKYGAKFGLDIEDWRQWAKELIDFIDNTYEGKYERKIYP